MAWQGPSPDEVALVDAARQLGFEFLSRSMGDVTLLLAGHEVRAHGAVLCAMLSLPSVYELLQHSLQWVVD